MHKGILYRQVYYYSLKLSCDVFTVNTEQFIVVVIIKHYFENIIKSIELTKIT